MRQYIPSPAGRQRFNVLGALNAVTHQMIVVTNDTYINAGSVVELLVEIVKSVAKDGTHLLPITLAMDNARYQKCQLVEDAVGILNTHYGLSIELLFLPAYSPNLNLIERYWRFVKSRALDSRYYRNFALFKQAILRCILEPDALQKHDLETLLTWNFQSFRKVHVLTG